MVLATFIQPFIMSTPHMWQNGTATASATGDIQPFITFMPHMWQNGTGDIHPFIISMLHHVAKWYWRYSAFIRFMPHMWLWYWRYSALHHVHAPSCGKMVLAIFSLYQVLHAPHVVMVLAIFSPWLHHVHAPHVANGTGDIQPIIIIMPHHVAKWYWRYSALASSYIHLHGEIWLSLCQCQLSCPMWQNGTGEIWLSLCQSVSTVMPHVAKLYW